MVKLWVLYFPVSMLALLFAFQSGVAILGVYKCSHLPIISFGQNYPSTLMYNILVIATKRGKNAINNCLDIRYLICCCLACIELGCICNGSMTRRGRASHTKAGSHYFCSRSAFKACKQSPLYCMVLDS